MKIRTRTALTAFTLFTTASLSGADLSCSLVVDPGTAQCDTDEDCAGRGPEFAGYLCSERKVCVKQAGCSTSQECIKANNGNPYICRPDRVCAALQTDKCKPYAEQGDIGNDDTIWMGAVYDLSGGTNSVSFGKPEMQTLDMARKEFAQFSSGLPPLAVGKKRRPLAFVGCDDGAGKSLEDDVQYLMNQVKVPVLMGFTTSSNLITAMNKYAVPAKQFLMVPYNGTTSFETADPGTPRTSWRVYPDPAEPWRVYGRMVGDIVEPIVRKAYSIPAATPIKAALVQSASAAPANGADLMFAVFNFNAKSASDNGTNFQRYNYGDPADPNHTDSQYAKVATDLAAQAPHIIVLDGFDEVPKVFSGPDGLETKWTTAGYKPYYIITNNSLTPKTYAAMTTKELRKRFVSANVDTDTELAKGVQSKYHGVYPSETPPPAALVTGCYDAFYLSAYALVANGQNPTTGPNLTAGILKLLPPGVPITLGPDSINDAFTALTSNQTLDVTGTTGPLNFDTKLGEAKANSKLLCFTAGADGIANGTQFVPVVYAADTGKVTGTYDCSSVP